MRREKRLRYKGIQDLILEHGMRPTSLFRKMQSEIDAEISLSTFKRVCYGNRTTLNESVFEWLANELRVDLDTIKERYSKKNSIKVEPPLKYKLMDLGGNW